MSLLEDIFLQDEASEAQELERIIEGEDDERPVRSDSDDDSVKDGEAEEEKQRVDPHTTKTRRIIKNPRFILNPARLTGPRGIQVIPDHFKDFKCKGKGHEKEDLDLVLKKLEHWAYRLYPKFQFGDCLKKIEMLGKKRPVMVHLTKIRSDQFLSEDAVNLKDSSDEETAPAPTEEDEFDRLLQQQIELARSTPAPSTAKKSSHNKDNSVFDTLLATTSPSISDEQRERILRSKQLAEEKRLARLNNTTNSINLSQDNAGLINTNDNIHNNKSDNVRTSYDEEDIAIKETAKVTEETNDFNVAKNISKNRFNVIHSSDEDDNVDKDDTKSTDYNRSEGKSTKNSFKNNSMVLDSTDEEDITMSEAVTVHVYSYSNANVNENSSDKDFNNIDNTHMASFKNITDDEVKTNKFVNNDKVINNSTDNYNENEINKEGNEVCNIVPINYEENHNVQNSYLISTTDVQSIIAVKSNTMREMDKNKQINETETNIVTIEDVNVSKQVNDVSSDISQVNVDKNLGIKEISNIAIDIVENNISINDKINIDNSVNNENIDIDKELMDVDFDEEF